MEKKPQSAGASVKTPSAPGRPAADSVDAGEDDWPPSLNDSLPSFSEPVRVSEKKQNSNLAQSRLAEVVKSLRSSKATSPAQPEVLSSLASAPRPKAQARTTLHQQLIDQTLRHKRQEILTQAFVKWRRGLRIQSQHRQQRAQQFDKLSTKLLGLRRNRMFFEWKALAGERSQVLSCRMDAFKERMASRKLIIAWTRWKLEHAVKFGRRRQLLYSVVLHMGMKITQRALFTWKLRTEMAQTHEQLAKIEQMNQKNWDLRALTVAQCHHSKRVLLPMLATIVRKWHAFSRAQVRKLRILRKLTLRDALRIKLKGWRQWAAAVVVARHADVLRQEHTAQVEGFLAQQRGEQQAQSLKTQQAHAKELQELHEELNEKEKELLALQRRDQMRDKEVYKLQQQLRDSEQRKNKLKQQWSESLESYFESAVKRVSSSWGISVPYDGLVAANSVVIGSQVRLSDRPGEQRPGADPPARREGRLGGALRGCEGTSLLGHNQKSMDF